MKTILIIFIFISTYSLHSKWELFEGNDEDIGNSIRYISKNNIPFRFYLTGFSYYQNNEWKIIDTSNSILPSFAFHYTEDNLGNVYFTCKNLFKPTLYKFKINDIENTIDSIVLPYDLRYTDLIEIYCDTNNVLWVANSSHLYTYKDGVWSEDHVQYQGGAGLYGTRFKHLNGYDDKIILSTYWTLIEAKLNPDTLVFHWIEGNYKTDGNGLGQVFINKNNDIFFIEYNSNNSELWKYDGNEWDYFENKINLDSSYVYSAQIDNEGVLYFMYRNEGKESIYKLENNNFIKIFDMDKLFKELNSEIDFRYEFTFLRLSAKYDNEYWFYFEDGLLKYTPDESSVRIENKVSLYPNPSADRIVINSEELISKLELYSLSLSKIESYQTNYNTSQELDISNLLRGVYFMKVNDDFYKFVKE